MATSSVKSDGKQGGEMDENVVKKNKTTPPRRTISSFSTFKRKASHTTPVKSKQRKLTEASSSPEVVVRPRAERLALLRGREEENHFTTGMTDVAMEDSLAVEIPPTLSRTNSLDLTLPLSSSSASTASSSSTQNRPLKGHVYFVYLPHKRLHCRRIISQIQILGGIVESFFDAKKVTHIVLSVAKAQAEPSAFLNSTKNRKRGELLISSSGAGKGASLSAGLMEAAQREGVKVVDVVRFSAKLDKRCPNTVISKHYPDLAELLKLSSSSRWSSGSNGTSSGLAFPVARARSLPHISLASIIKGDHFQQVMRKSEKCKMSSYPYVCIRDLTGMFPPMKREFPPDDKGTYTIPCLNFSPDLAGYSPFLREAPASASSTRQSKAPNKGSTEGTSYSPSKDNWSVKKTKQPKQEREQLTEARAKTGAAEVAGWCECCQMKFASAADHLVTKQHRDYATKNSNYAVWDALFA